MALEPKPLHARPRAAKDDGRRGDTPHEMHALIVQAAEERFRRHGYAKTTVADIAGELDVSTAYIYKFYDSKMAILEAVCSTTLAKIGKALWSVAESDDPAPTRFARVYQTLLSESVNLFFNDRQLYDLVRVGCSSRFPAVDTHKQTMRGVMRRIIGDGRADGTFETETPLDETVDAVAYTLIQFAHPLVLETEIGRVDLVRMAAVTARLVLAGLRK
ncbi:TetR/AcrR family transcriptional regulator [Zavarzinia sp. CC-PAN008]|uniref:TetR/AcrR family transcriptional regulator n=1 Tax=Zavarzinia sp. CC-PAN008 TaxID=3243332 RepID=UPI003F7481BA